MPNCALEYNAFSFEQMQVGIDNTAGRSGFFINTVSSYAAPRRHKGGRRATINHGGNVNGN
jgi:hypothetical protein